MEAGFGTSTQELPFGKEVEFEVGQVEEKTRGTRADGSEWVILKIALRAEGVEPFWAETFGGTDSSKWPKAGEKHTYVLERPSKPEYAPTAKRPRSGGGRGGRGGGGGYRPDPVQESAKNGAVVAESAYKSAVELVASKGGSDLGLDGAVSKVHEIAGSFIEAILRVQEAERAAAKDRVAGG